MQIDHGTFTQYTPPTPNIPAAPIVPVHPGESVSQEALAAYEAEVVAHNLAYASWEETTAPARKLKAMIAAGSLFCANENALDWYTIAHAGPVAGHTFAMLRLGVVVTVSTDPERMWPLEHQVIETDNLSVARGWSLVEGVLTDPATIAPTPEELTAHAAAKRWEKEVGGCMVDGHPVATDRESQSKLLAAFVAIGAGVRVDPSPWKFANGQFALLTNAQMFSVCTGVFAFVAAAFTTEEAVLTNITNGSITTRAEIDAAFAT